MAAVLIFTILLPAMALVALILAVLSRRTPLIAHRRVGWRGADLWMLKFRTMWDTKGQGVARGWVEPIDDEAGPRRKRAADPRVSNWFAGFCRRHSIDELPQLWHVIRGEMSLVGPRPVTAAEIRKHYGEDADELLCLKPGIAGLWQTSGRNRLTYQQRRALDLEFVRERSVRMYFRILLRTIPEMIWGGNTW